MIQLTITPHNITPLAYDKSYRFIYYYILYINSVNSICQECISYAYIYLIHSLSFCLLHLYVKLQNMNRRTASSFYSPL